MNALLTQRSVEVGGTALNVMDVAPADLTRSRRAVVLSHGAGGSLLNWYHQIAHLSSDRRVIAWDQRGFGRSPDPAREASPARAAKDLLAVLEACQVDEVWLVAQSMGGWGGSLCVRDHPELFRGLILCDTVAGVVDDRVRARLDEFMESSSQSADSGRLFSSLAYAASWAERDRASATALHLMAKALPADYPTAVADIRDTVIGTEHLRQLPVAAIVGSEDQIFPPDLVRELLGGVADLGVHEIRGAGHSPYVESPTSFNEVLDSLID